MVSYLMSGSSHVPPRQGGWVASVNAAHKGVDRTNGDQTPFCDSHSSKGLGGWVSTESQMDIHEKLLL